MWNYNYSDDRNDWLAHTAGFKYLSKKFVNGKWVYIYPEDVARGSNTNGDPRLQRSQTGTINVNKNAVTAANFIRHPKQSLLAKRKAGLNTKTQASPVKSTQPQRNKAEQKREMGNRQATAYYKETGERLDQAEARAKKHGNDTKANEKAMQKNIQENKKRVEKNKVSAANTANAAANVKMTQATNKAVAQEKSNKKAAKSAVKTSAAKTNARYEQTMNKLTTQEKSNKKAAKSATKTSAAKTNARYEQTMKKLTAQEDKRNANAKAAASNANAKSNAKAQKQLDEETRRRLNAYKKYRR